LRSNSETDALNRKIVQTIREKKPENVNQLVILLKETLQLTEKQAQDAILELQNKGEIDLKAQPQPTSLSIRSYIETVHPLWFEITIALAISALSIVLAIPEDLAPWSYLRNISGAVFVLWLPGYSFIKALFPVHVPFETSTRDLDTVERVALSLAASLAIVPLVGLLLNYSIWGLSLVPIVLCLFALTLIFAMVAVIREARAEAESQELQIE
jgi:hypothetical protein